MTLDREALQVANDLGEVVFVGAFAVLAYVGAYRQTGDLDLAVATPKSESDLEALGYLTRQEGKKRVTRTPSGIKLDIYTEDVGGIPVAKLFGTATKFKVGKRYVLVMGLEGLLLSKLRAGRPQDLQDLRELIQRKGKTVAWGTLEALGCTEMEADTIRTTIRALT
jgi:hypothetical protein